MQELLQQYARLVIQTGVNLQRNQILVINAPIECAEFARLVASEAYKAGAHDVVIAWNDEKFSRLRYDMAAKNVFTEFPEWRYKFYMDYAEQGAAFVSIAARNPEIFQGVDEEKMLLAQQASGAALMEYRQRMMSNKNTWCVVSIPTAGWAKKVFPSLGEKEAVAKLWQEIFAAVRVEPKGDAVAAWEKHKEFLRKATAFMNEKRFAKLHYQNSLGTDLWIKLPKGHIWAGGVEYTPNDVGFVANMPTEEIYTLPQRDGVDGIVVATKPLVYNGNVIENFSVRFAKGKAVEVKAEKGEKILQQLIATDEGASHLGEVALVPYDSPISQSGILFYNTLFDENAACHLAFGKAYPTCLEAGAEMTETELEIKGVNNSLLHEDFMIGSRDLSITGFTPEGEEIAIFVDGNFARGIAD